MRHERPLYQNLKEGVSISAAAGGKFNACPTANKNGSYRSKLEARRHTELLMLEKGKQVRNIQQEVPYRLEVNGQLVCKYYADFVYEQFDGRVWKEVIEDCRVSPRSPMFTS